MSVRRLYRSTRCLTVCFGALSALVDVSARIFASVKRAVVQFFGRLSEKRARIGWLRAPKVLPVFKGVFALKPDKVREFFGFLRVKQSWMTS